jgi:hypothetical protein
VSDNRVTFRYDRKKIEALKSLAYLERKKASQIIREALDMRLGLIPQKSVEPEDFPDAG